MKTIDALTLLKIAERNNCAKLTKDSQWSDSAEREVSSWVSDGAYSPRDVAIKLMLRAVTATATIQAVSGLAQLCAESTFFAQRFKFSARALSPSEESLGKLRAAFPDCSTELVEIFSAVHTKRLAELWTEQASESSIKLIDDYLDYGGRLPL